MRQLKKLGVLGKGSFSSVYLVEDPNTLEKFALKKVVIHEEDSSEKVKSEGSILQSLNHPNIIKLIESYMKVDKYYMLLDYAKNGDLAKKLKKMNANKTCFLETEIIPSPIGFVNKVFT